MKFHCRVVLRCPFRQRQRRCYYFKKKFQTIRHRCRSVQFACVKYDVHRCVFVVVIVIKIIPLVYDIIRTAGPATRGHV